ncbi:MAG: LysM domain-containing protein, partial [Bdellovibrionota bacterium]
MKYWALSLSLLGLGACSSTKTGAEADASASDSSYANVPSSEAPAEGGAEGSVAPEASALGGPQAHHHSGVAYRGSHFPEISKRVVQKGGYALNGYVFVRNEQNWKDLSKLLYGRADRAALLAEWNGNSEIKPGAVVYYNSPFRPDDSSELKSFDTDFGMTLTGVSVSAGDSLSSIAAKVYGSPDAWRELASLNADLLTSPDQIEIGQNLRLAPASRDTAGILQAYVQKVQGEATAALKEPMAPQGDHVAQESQNPQDQHVATTQNAQAPPVASDLRVTSSNDPSKLPIKDIAMMLGALLAVAALVAVIVRRRKKLVATNVSNTVFFGKKTG